MKAPISTIKAAVIYQDVIVKITAPQAMLFCVLRQGDILVRECSKTACQQTLLEM